MEKGKDDTIAVWTVVEETQNQESMFPPLARARATTQHVLTEDISRNLSATVAQLKLAFERLPPSLGEYSIDTITVALGVNGSGGIALVGEISAGFQSSITLTFRRVTRDTEESDS
jgi:hypothetical protein